MAVEGCNPISGHIKGPGTFLGSFLDISPCFTIQDSPICPLTVGGKARPYIDQGWLSVEYRDVYGIRHVNQNIKHQVTILK